MDNAATSFREAVTENLAQVFLGQGHFEQQVRYFPRDGGGARDITALPDRDVKRNDDRGHHLVEAETLVLTCARNEETGIGTPGLGDAVSLDGGATKWDFDEVVRATFAFWTVRWKRTVLQRAGQYRPGGF